MKECKSSEGRKFKKHTDLPDCTKTDSLYTRTSNLSKTSFQNHITYLLITFYTAVIHLSTDSLNVCDNHSFVSLFYVLRVPETMFNTIPTRAIFQSINSAVSLFVTEQFSTATSILYRHELTDMNSGGILFESQPGYRLS
jgi:hypothetical protein